MTSRRSLSWDSCCNVRDLGGLPTQDGNATRWGAVVRSDHPSKLSARGWASAWDHGIRTVIELTTFGEDRDLPDRSPRPTGLTTIEVEIEDCTDAEFKKRWIDSKLWGTPFYFSDALQRWPRRHAKLIECFATAPPGGVLVHCVRGFDRTGLACLLLLSLAGVRAAHIADDYELSDGQMPVEQQRELQSVLLRENRSLRDGIVEVLEGFAIEDYLLAAGLTRDTLESAKTRLIK